MQNTATIEHIGSIYHSLAPVMDERMRRQGAAAEAKAYGGGGIRAVSRATGLAPNTIRSGWAELTRRDASSHEPLPARLRRPGGGRKRRSQTDPDRLPALQRLVDPVTRGDPMAPWRWTSKSTTQVAPERTRQGHPVSPSTGGRRVKAAGDRLQSHRKTQDGASHPDRNAPFEPLNATVPEFQCRGQPVLSVDTTTKELGGDSKNGGRQWRPKGDPAKGLSHDFRDKDRGQAIPSGVSDLTANQGGVRVGSDPATARFAAAAIRRWGMQRGSQRYRDARELLITAPGGGSNGRRCRLGKVARQDRANPLGIPVPVGHFPPGTSQWNQIEHGMFGPITQHGRGRPRVSPEVIINRIAGTATEQGLTIQAELDTGEYPTGIKVSDEELAAVKMEPNDFHGNWNYRIGPSRKKQ